MKLNCNNSTWLYFSAWDTQSSYEHSSSILKMLRKTTLDLYLLLLINIFTHTHTPHLELIEKKDEEKSCKNLASKQPLTLLAIYFSICYIVLWQCCNYKILFNTLFYPAGIGSHHPKVINDFWRNRFLAIINFVCFSFNVNDLLASRYKIKDYML